MEEVMSHSKKIHSNPPPVSLAGVATYLSGSSGARSPTSSTISPCGARRCARQPVLVNCAKQIFVTSPYSVWEGVPVTFPPSHPSHQMERPEWCRDRGDTGVTVWHRGVAPHTRPVSGPCRRRCKRRGLIVRLRAKRSDCFCSGFSLRM